MTRWKPRVLLVSVHGDPLARIGSMQAGGQNVYVRELAFALARQGWEVDVATHRSSPAQPAEEVPVAGVRVLRLDAGRPEFVPKDQLAALIPAFAGQLAACLERSGSLPQVIHSNYWISGQVGLRLRQRWQVPQVHTFHSLGKVRLQAMGVGQRRDMAVRLEAEQRLVDGVDAVLASNPVEAGLLREHYRVPEGKLRLLPCGIDPAVFYPRSPAAARALLGLPDRIRAFCFAGRFEQNKGLAELLRALALVVKRNPDLQEQVQLFVAGGTAPGTGAASPEERALHGLAADLGLQARVHFLGPLPQADLAVYFAAAVATVVPSYYETFGLVALEAMACGCPVVASHTGGFRFTVRHGENGLLVPPGDVPALAAALEQLLLRPDLAARLREHLREGVPARFTWRHIAAQAERIYEEVAGEALAANQAAGD